MDTEKGPIGGKGKDKYVLLEPLGPLGPKFYKASLYPKPSTHDRTKTWRWGPKGP